MKEHDIGRSKQTFFDELYALDDDIGNEPRDDGLIRSMNALKRCSELASTSPVKPSPTRTRKPVRTVSAPITTVSQRLPPLAKLQTRHTVIGEAEPISISHMPPTSSTVSDGVMGGSKRSAPVESSTTPKSLFEGLQFCTSSIAQRDDWANHNTDFFPNNDIHPGRRFRINKAVQHGANWAKTWSNDVSHVIVDRSMNYGQVVGFLKLDIIPVGVIFQTFPTPADSVASRQNCRRGLSGGLHIIQNACTDRSASVPCKGSTRKQGGSRAGSPAPYRLFRFGCVTAAQACW